MKNLALAAALGAALAATSVQAQTLHPQMSAQDVSTQMDAHHSHMIVPILTMLMLIAAGTGGYGGK
ncbi:hypothetical protein HKCCSP123_09380 [Rhodobacterales bacterium HKCCSP123]|nr:hypothetical protein [Rhodobacterales bacterium HKCCSP123]